jgi:hypothetical protein
MNLEPPTEPPGRDAPEPVAAVDPLDERLSAALDGMWESGSDSGPGTESAPDDLAADTRALERSRALAAARDLLAIPPPPLDDLTRRRMVRAALAASPPSKHRDLRWLSRVTVAAALLAVVVMAGWALTTLDNTSSKSSGKVALSPATTAVKETLDLQDVSDPLVLERRVRAALRSVSPAGAPQIAGPTPTTPSGGRADALARCQPTVRVPAGVVPGILGTATYHGQPALVVVARDHSRTWIFVVASTDCRLLSSQFLRR